MKKLIMFLVSILLIQLSYKPALSATTTTSTTTTTTLPSRVCCGPLHSPTCQQGTSCSSRIHVPCSNCPNCPNCIDPYPSVTFYWTNVKSSYADVYIKAEAGSIYYGGKITFEIRKHVFGIDPYCDLNGNCGSSRITLTAIDPVGSGTREYRATFTAKEEGDYHFDVYYYEGNTMRKHYGTTINVRLVPCESSAYTSCGSALIFGSLGGSKSNMCGSEQYYAVSSPTGKKCRITWSVTPSDANYDLYVKWFAACPSTSSYDCGSTNSGTSSESCSARNVLSSYAMVKKVSGTGTYNISVSVSDCVDAGCKDCGSPTSNNCWRKVKGENCNDLSWYDFHQEKALCPSQMFLCSC